MQISRHWRLNAQRYRLEGFRNCNGELSLQARPAANASEDVTSQQTQEAESVVSDLNKVATTAA